MRRQAAAIMVFVLALASSSRAQETSSGKCVSAMPFTFNQGARWTGWSPDVNNTRFQPTAQAGITATNVSKLTLKWAFGFPGATAAFALPTLAGGRVFVGSQGGAVYSLDAKTGCTVWTYQAGAGVRTAIVVGGNTVYFGDVRANVYAVDAASGKLLWTRKLDDHSSARITGSPTLYQNRLYVPVSSFEEGQGGNARYECCTFRGSIAALDIGTGNVVWQTHTIPDEPKPIGKNNSGTVRRGPSGAAIWSSPTIDTKRRVLYAATGNMYTEPQHPTADAVLAFDLEKGSIVWTSQVTPKDIFVVGCGSPNGANCPQDVGPDFDFGNSPLLTTLPGGRDILVIGQKSGVGWALDPEKRGAVIWQYRAGKGSELGGMEWGSALDSEYAYFPVSDILTPQPGGLHAVKLATGERGWFAPPPPVKCAAGRGCNPALAAAITVIPGIVFAGSNDGAVRGFSTKDGSIVWEFDTNRTFETINGVTAKGGSINGPGPTVAGGMLFINSGYSMFGGRPGNVLLAFSIN